MAQGGGRESASELAATIARVRNYSYSAVAPPIVPDWIVIAPTVAYVLLVAFALWLA